MGGRVSQDKPDPELLAHLDLLMDFELLDAKDVDLDFLQNMDAADPKAAPAAPSPTPSSEGDKK